MAFFFQLQRVWLLWTEASMKEALKVNICRSGVKVHGKEILGIDPSLSIRFPWYHWRSSAETWRSGSVVAWTHFTTIPRVAVQCVHVTLVNVLHSTSQHLTSSMTIPWKPDAQKGVYTNWYVNRQCPRMCRARDQKVHCNGFQKVCDHWLYAISNGLNITAFTFFASNMDLIHGQ